MEKYKESPVLQHIVSLFRQLLVFSIIVAVAVIAIFWESLPVSVKKTVTSLSAISSDEDVMTPPKFRIEHPPEIDETKNKQSTKVEYRNTQTSDEVDEVIDNALLEQLHDELKQLGATSCRLTYWGDHRNMFRFSCQVPVSEQHTNVTRTFQSIAPDAVQSIQEVIDQIRKNEAAKK